MSSVFGVNVKTSVEASRPIRVDSITPLGVVGSCAGLDTGLHLYGSSELAKAALTDLADKTGSLMAAVDGIDDQNVNSPLVLSVFRDDDDAAITKTNVINGISLLKKAESELGYRPNIIVAPEHSHDGDVNAEMQAVAEKLRGHAIIDLNVEDEAAAITALDSYGTKRAILCDPYVKVWNTETSQSEFQPMSARIAGMIAATDGAWEYGFADSFSNRVMNGISGTKRSIEWIPGDTCEADRLRTGGITSIIRYSGFRAWGGETTDIDTVWQSMTRVRIFDRVCEATLDGLFWAIDRRADQLKYAKDSMEQLLLALKGADVLLGFEVLWDEELNTRANITAGKFYMKVYMQDMPIVKRLEVNFTYTDRYGDVLLQEIA